MRERETEEDKSKQRIQMRRNGGSVTLLFAVVESRPYLEGAR